MSERSRKSVFRWPLAAALAATVVGAASTGFADSPARGEWVEEERFLSSLRERRLSGLLEQHCTGRLKAVDLSDPLRRLLAVELASELADRASRTRDDDARAALWRRSDRLLEETETRLRRAEERILLRSARARAAAARALWHADWSELYPDRSDARTDAARQLETARERLERSIDELGRLEEDQKRRDPSLADIRLGNLVRLGQVEFLLHQSSAVEPGRRGPFLDSSIESLSKASKDLRTDASARALAALWLARALRSRGDVDAADQVLESHERLGVGDAFREEWIAERVQNLFARERWREGLLLLAEEFGKRSPPPARWRWLQVKAKLALAQGAPAGSRERRSAEDEAYQLVLGLEREHPGAWSRRARLALAEYASRLGVADAQVARRAARVLEKSDRLSQAAALLERSAREHSSDREAARLFFEAAGLYERAGEFDPAIRAFHEAYERSGDAGPAAEALAREIACALARASPSPEREGELKTLFEEHARRFSAEPSSATVRLMAGEFFRRRGEFADAIAQLLAVPVSSPVRPRALLLASRVHEDRLEPLHGGMDEEHYPAALSFLEEAAAEADRRGGDFPEELRSELVLRHARFLLDPRGGDPARARRALESLAARPALAQSSLLAARRYLLLALVMDERTLPEAERLAESLAEGPADQLLSALELLNRYALDAPEGRAAQIGRIERRLCAALEAQSAEIRPERRGDVELARALAEIFAGDDHALASAARRLEDLASSRPRDARVTQAQALLAMRSRRYERAIELWKTLVAGLKKETPSWYRAQLHLIRSLRRSNQKAEARRNLELLEILHPRLGGPALAPRFAEEKERLGRARAERAGAAAGPAPA